MGGYGKYQSKLFKSFVDFEQLILKMCYASIIFTRQIKTKLLNLATPFRMVKYIPET